MPQSEPHRQLSAVAPAFWPVENLTETVQNPQLHGPDPVIRDAVSQPTLAATPPAEVLQEEQATNETGEEADSGEYQDYRIHVTEPSGEEVPLNSSNEASRHAHI